MNNPAQKSSHLNRREALQTVAIATAAAAGGLTGAARAETTTINAPSRNADEFWPNGARLAVSLSLMFEGGGQPISGASGVIPDLIEKGVSDQLTRDDEKDFIAGSVETIHKITGQNPLERLLDAQLHPHSGDAAGTWLYLSHRRAKPRRAIYRAGARTGFRDRPLYFPLERHCLLSLRWLGRGRLRAGAARRVRSALRGGCATAAHDGDQPARSYLRATQAGASPRSLPDLAKKKEDVWFARKDEIAR